MHRRPTPDAQSPRRTRPSGDLLERLVFLRALYRLRGSDDAVGVIRVEQAMTLANHRFEVLRHRDRHIDAVRRHLRC